MNRLKGSKFYLAGAMDEVADGGVSWREEITPKLFAMGIGVLNPASKPCPGFIEDFELRKKIKEYKSGEKWEEARNLIKPIVGVDLRMVHTSDGVILYIDKENFIFGSVVEFTWAIQQRKPVLIVVKQGKKEVPGFALGMNPHEMIFGNFDDMFTYIRHIDQDEVINDKRRWYFFDQKKIYGE